MSEPLFHSENLEQAFKQVKDTISSIPRIKDHVSSDIKNLEKMLVSLAIKEDFILVVNDEHIETEEDLPPGGYPLDIHQVLHCKIVKESIKWDSKQNRLIYVRHEADGDVNPDYMEFTGKYYAHGEFQVTETLLTQTKFDLRKTMSTYLPEFLKALKSKYT